MKSIVAALLSLLLLFSPVAWGEEQEVVVLILPESVNVSGTKLLLGSIAEIVGPSELVEQVTQINAGTAPRPGSSRRLTKGQIEVRLRQGGVDLTKIEFQGVDTIQVIGVAATAPTGKSYGEVQSEPGFPVYEVVVAARDLTRGEILSAEDLVVEAREFRSGEPDPRSLEEFVGLRASRSILAGAPLTELNVEVVPVIERGDAVTILVRSAGLVVTAPGVARGSGGIGEIITVENTLSKQRLQAEIIDAHTVEVNMRGSGTP